MDVNVAIQGKLNTILKYQHKYLIKPLMWFNMMFSYSLSTIHASNCPIKNFFFVDFIKIKEI